MVYLRRCGQASHRKDEVSHDLSSQMIYGEIPYVGRTELTTTSMQRREANVVHQTEKSHTTIDRSQD